MVPQTGVEPVTFSLQVSCATNCAIEALVAGGGVEPPLLGYEPKLEPIQLTRIIIIS